MTGGLRCCTQTNPNPSRSKSRNPMIPFGYGGGFEPPTFGLQPNRTILSLIDSATPVPATPLQAALVDRVLMPFWCQLGGPR